MAPRERTAAFYLYKSNLAHRAYLKAHLSQETFPAILSRVQTDGLSVLDLIVMLCLDKSYKISMGEKLYAYVMSFQRF